jgi:hypothetical protein
MAETLEELQQRICRTYGAEFEPPSPHSKVGIALQTMGRIPIHGVRVPATGAVCGWYIFAGSESSDDPEFYQPLCLDHLEEYCKDALPLLGLPPGWHFLTDGQGYVDVWFDGQLLR